MRPVAGTLTLRGLVIAAAFASASTPAAAPQTPAPGATAEIGIELPTLGGVHWFNETKPRYYTAEVMRDIRDNLHAAYVRTGWIPGRLHYEKIRWYREDQGMDAICSAGLKAMIIVPSPPEDRPDDALVANVHEFFARYTQREAGCIQYAEVANEADLPHNGFSNVTYYAQYYRRIAPILAAFGLTVITSGTSGKDLPWTWALARLLQAPPAAVVGGYGYHPYGVPPAQMAATVGEVARAAGARADGTLTPVYVTEIGEQNPIALYEAIVELAHVTPAITIYEYLPQPGEDPGYGLKSDPARYDAVRRAWATLHTGASRPPANSSPARR